MCDPCGINQNWSFLMYFTKMKYMLETTYQIFVICKINSGLTFLGGVMLQNLMICILGHNGCTVSYCGASLVLCQYSK